MEKILVCRNTWMETYSTPYENPVSYHKFVRDGNTPWECLNFERNGTGVYSGYVQVAGDAKGNYGKININRLGARAKDTEIGDVLVVLAATHPRQGGTRVVGFYHNSTVFRHPKLVADTLLIPDAKETERIIRFESDCVELLPLEDRIFKLPNGKGGIGRSDLWYGLNEPHNFKLKEELLRFSQSRLVEHADNRSDEITESRKVRLSKRVERRSGNRQFIYEKGFKCEACEFGIDEADEPFWGSSFELHHKTPLSKLRVGDVRTATPDDFAVLCANCHRAIHRAAALEDPEIVSNIPKFRRKFLGRGP